MFDDRIEAYVQSRAQNMTYKAFIWKREEEKLTLMRLVYDMKKEEGQ